MKASLEWRFSQKWTVESAGDEDDEDDGEDGDDEDDDDDDVISWVRQMKKIFFIVV